MRPYSIAVPSRMELDSAGGTPAFSERGEATRDPIAAPADNWISSAAGVSGSATETLATRRKQPPREPSVPAPPGMTPTVSPEPPLNLETEAACGPSRGARPVRPRSISPTRPRLLPNP
jgi:hypothetical protein